MSAKYLKPISLMAMAVVIAAAPAASQQNKSPKTQVWIDLATHDFAGMPDMGGMGGLAMNMFGGSSACVWAWPSSLWRRPRPVHGHRLVQQHQTGRARAAGYPFGIDAGKKPESIAIQGNSKPGRRARNAW